LITAPFDFRFAERYDSRAECLPGNFPQAFSHVSPINTARNLTRASGSAGTRKEA
jgi:GH15 family glucan-1,4-alpha-glucosidase